MSGKTELEKTLEYGIMGTPQIKPEEKRIWLGEFRERIILGLTMEQVRMMEAPYIVRKALKDPMAEILIVNNNIPMEITRNYMKLAREMDKEYKSMPTDAREAMGLVVVSRSAVERKDVLVDIKEIPAKFKKTQNKSLCTNCYKELEDINPDMAKDFKKINPLGKLLGINCGACSKE